MGGAVFFSEAAGEHGANSLDGFGVFCLSRQRREHIGVLAVRCILPVTRCAHVGGAAPLLKHACYHEFVRLPKAVQFAHQRFTNLINQARNFNFKF